MADLNRVADICPFCGEKFSHDLMFCDDCGKRWPWAPPRLTEKEIHDLFVRLFCVGPLWLPPFDMEDEREREKFYEDKVQADLWGNFDLLIQLLLQSFKEEQDSAWQTHLSDFLAAMCRLSPERYIEKVTPLLEQPELREELIFSVGVNNLPQTIEWLKPWISRLKELNDSEINTIVEFIGLVGAEHSQLNAEAQNLLQQIHAQVPKENASVHHNLEWYSGVLKKYERADKQS